MIGKSILHYSITEKLGEGGMGTVYKAEDTKLKRNVAIKFLPRHIAASETEHERFKIEAQAAAALNHPNIATIYAIEEADEETFIVMEYIEGEELANLGKVDNLPKVLDVATQIAEGLKAAHAKGIVHRDIKSSNIMVTESGQVKIMDFGLAKVGGDVQLTKAGTTLGTAAYMSPEQARGEEVDHRSDIWSFGVVQYEMLTGQLPFRGEYEQALMYAIANQAPDPLTELRKDAPPESERIVFKCLEKESEDRYQSVEHLLADLRKLKKDIESGKGVGRAVRPITKKRKRVAGVAIGAAALLLVLALIFMARGLFQKGSGAPKVVRMFVLTQSPTISEKHPAISPDGGRVAYGSNESGNYDIWVQQIASGEKRNLTKDHLGNDGYPCWSPDGDWIAFFSDRSEGGIFIMSSLGGYPRQVTAQGGEPCWSPDGAKLVYSHKGKLFIIPTSGGTPEQVPLDHDAYNPTWAPDGSRIAYATHGPGSEEQICSIGADGSDPVVVIGGPGKYHNPVWAKGGRGIFFKSDRGGTRDMWWVPVDQRGKATGPPQSVTVGGVVYSPSLSQDGRKVAFTSGTPVHTNIWSIPTGSGPALTMKDAFQIGSEQGYVPRLAVSPDRERLAFESNRSGNVDIWVMRKDGRDRRQLTTNSAWDGRPDWSPDGRRIAFVSERNGNWDIFLIPAQGGLATTITDDPAIDGDPAWSPDGDEIVFGSNRSGNWDLWVVSVGAGDLRQLTTHEAGDGYSAWSPDGRYISFASERTGAWELYVLPVAGGEPKQLTHFGASSRFGKGPWGQDARSVWSVDSRMIYATYELKPEDPGSDIWAISREDGSMRKVLDFSSGGRYGQYLYSLMASDGERLYFSVLDWRTEISIAELEYE